MDDTEIYGVKGEISPHCELTLTIERTNSTAEVKTYQAGGVLKGFAREFLGQSVV
ncbi:hypothetical protein [Moraxella catarrhalis]|uniref:Uncharacterized protein n=1 Tax=Moraxella catarrhalis TaxID=480 RepID=A0AB36DQN7_MORCA|nr:hypothetical protein [Moraxella catarrhalis]OAV27093.1 hypothetical protein AO370_0434 [Moraxella catarrhalis]OAV32629.1 hypothetical protein AO368_0232 [Moraxella catarrhalis]